MRIAMWSGPRNISTALMRAWENRPDAWVVDEPLYAHYLTQVTGRASGRRRGDPASRQRLGAGRGRPGRADSRTAAASTTRSTWPTTGCRTCAASGSSSLTNAFLIRHPAEMLPSLAAKMGLPVLRDTGLPQQVEIFRDVQRAHRRDAAGPRRRGRAQGSARRAGTVLRAGRRRLRRARCCTGRRAAGRPTASGPSTGTTRWSARPASSRSRRGRASVAPELEPLLAECLPYYDELAAAPAAGA